MSKPTYEELEAQVKQLAAERDAVVAENSQIKAMNDCLAEELRSYESDGAFEGPDMHRLWWKCEFKTTDAILASLRAEGVKALPRIQEHDIKALLRFNETCEDGEGYDIGEEAMTRLVEIGLCRKGARRVRHITPFGQWVIDAQEGEIDLTPLRTESDVNADFSAHIAQLRSQSEQVQGVQS